MFDEMIKRIIWAAIESFPINEKRKARMLQSIMDEKKTKEADNNVLR